MFKKVLIANRGEIACRIARTCRRLGIAVVGVHSSADRDALHTAEIGESICLGAAAAAESYLRIDAVIDAARRSGAQAIHPGYGFLAENPAFARAVEAAGLIFIGPTPEVIERLGNKALAKAEARAAGVAVLGGGEFASADPEVVAGWANKLPLPLLLKPAAGGGGKGMHVVRERDALHGAIGTAMREARASFGDSALIVEPYVEHGRHIEVQIAGDGRGEVIHLYERECTLQRRHQKLIEEAPAAPLPVGLREQILADSVRLGQRLNYRGVGTVEFLVFGNEHWFLEVNPRLQVEHPVTEEVTGVDIVELMLQVSAGEGLKLRQSDIMLRGHAVEARVCAEDAAHDFMPSTGEIVDVHFPDRGVRVETGVRAGSVVTPYYDSMVAKLIVHGPDRDAALDRLSLALGQTRVMGVTTNCRFLQQLIALPQTRDGSFHTRSVDEALLTLGAPLAASASLLAAAAAWWLHDIRSQGAGYGAWSARDVTGWQMNAGDDPTTMVPVLMLREGGLIHEIRFGEFSSNDELLVQVDAERIKLSLQPQVNRWRLAIGDRVETLTIVRRGVSLFLHAPNQEHEFEIITYLAQAGATQATSGELRAPLMGMILNTHATVGDRVRAGAVVVTMESMKMEMKICAEHDGVVRSLMVTAGQTVDRGSIVAVVEAEVRGTA